MRGLITVIFFILASANLTAYGQETYSFEFDVKSEKQGNVTIEYVQRIDNKYVTTRLTNQEMKRSWSTVTFTIPVDFKDLKIIFSSVEKINNISLRAIYLKQGKNQSAILTEDFVNIFTALKIKVNAINKNEIVYKTTAISSSLRLNITLFKPYIYEVKKVPFQVSYIKLRFFSKKNIRVRVYYANGSIKGYPFKKQNFIFVNVPSTDSIQTIKLKLASTFDVDLFRIDFERKDNQLNLYSLTYNSNAINRSWDFTSFLQDFVVTTPNSFVDIREDNISILNHDPYASLVTKVPLESDSVIAKKKQIQLLKLILMIISVPVFYLMNKGIMSHNKLRFE